MSIRKYPSGYEKLKKKKKRQREELIECKNLISNFASQKGVQIFCPTLPVPLYTPQIKSCHMSIYIIKR